MGAFNLDGWCRAAAARVFDEYRIAPGWLYLSYKLAQRENALEQSDAVL